MEKRYQVFISSTFADLEEERKGVMEAIIELDCFPAGMEMFPASNKEQFEYIRSVIDESDYYVLIVAGRYGSEADDGISYTEKEFDYAKEKGIPILAFVKKDIETLPANKVEKSEEKRKKLEQFREKVLDGRMANFWDSGEELKYRLHSSLAREMKVNPRVGWIRGNSSADIGLNMELNKIREENVHLKEQYDKLLFEKEQVKSEKKNEEKITLKKRIESEFEIRFIPKNIDSRSIILHTRVTTSVREILERGGHVMIYGFNRIDFEEYLAMMFNLKDEKIRHKDREEIILKLMALGLVEVEGHEDDDLIEVTNFGKKIILGMVKF